MFSSNQVLNISGSFHQLHKALEFALNVNGSDFTNKSTTSKCVYQITEDGRYCIGKIYETPKKGWNEFQFDFDLNIISQIIVQFLSKQDITWEDDGDGGYNKGFIMKAIPESMGDEYNGIKEPFYGIVEFKPFVCFYSK